MNLRRLHRAIKAGASDVLLAPVFESERVCLYYDDGRIDKSNLPADRSVLKRSGVKPNLLTGTAKLMGLEHESQLRIVCDLVEYRGEEWLLAREIEVVSDGEWVSSAVNRMLQLHILHAKGFSTVLPLCSWLTVTGVQKDGSAKLLRELPASKSVAVTQLRNRVNELRDALKGGRPHYWAQSTLFSKRLKTRYGRRPLPIRDVLDVEVVDVAGARKPVW